MPRQWDILVYDVQWNTSSECKRSDALIGIMLEIDHKWHVKRPSTDWLRRICVGGPRWKFMIDKDAYWSQGIHAGYITNCWRSPMMHRDAIPRLLHRPALCVRMRDGLQLLLTLNINRGFCSGLVVKLVVFVFFSRCTIYCYLQDFPPKWKPGADLQLATCGWKTDSHPLQLYPCSFHSLHWWQCLLFVACHNSFRVLVFKKIRMWAWLGKDVKELQEKKSNYSHPWQDSASLPISEILESHKAQSSNRKAREFIQLTWVPHRAYRKSWTEYPSSANHQCRQWDLLHMINPFSG